MCLKHESKSYKKEGALFQVTMPRFETETGPRFQTSVTVASQHKKADIHECFVNIILDRASRSRVSIQAAREFIYKLELKVKKY